MLFIKKKYFKIKIQFLDNIIKLNSMFRNCKSLNSIHNFGNLNTKHIMLKICLYYLMNVQI